MKRALAERAKAQRVEANRTAAPIPTPSLSMSPSIPKDVTVSVGGGGGIDGRNGGGIGIENGSVGNGIGGGVGEYCLAVAWCQCCQDRCMVGVVAIGQAVVVGIPCAASRIVAATAARL